MLDPAITANDGAWPPPLPDEGQTVTLTDAVLFVKRWFWLIVGCTAAAVALAMAYLMTTPAEYVASAQVLIEPGKQQLLWQETPVSGVSIDNAQVESQIQVLRSEQIADSVISALKLTDDPEFRSKLANSPYERQRIALARFEDALTARRIGQSYVIEVEFRSTNAAKAAEIANAITTAYIREQRSAKTATAEQASKWMETRITELGLKLNAAAAAAQEYRVSHGINDNGNGTQNRLIDKLTELEARAEAYRKLYENFLERLTENEQQASYPVSNAQVITAASRPLAKSSPKSKLVMLLAILGGLIIGLAVAAARAILDGSVRNAKQIRQALGLDCLGSLPLYRVPADGEQPGRHVEIVDAPFSTASEALRSIKVSIHSACRGTPPQCLGVLSLLPGDGASTIALNLAASFAMSGTKTLLIDADFREQSLSRRLAPGASAGLVEALRGGGANTIVFDPKTTAYLLPLAERGPVPNSADLLGSPAMQRLLPELKNLFATVIIDLPALLRVVDARAVGPLLDGCILVAAYGRTPLRALEEAAAILRADRVPLLGVIITQVVEGIPPLLGMHLDWRRRQGAPS